MAGLGFLSVSGWLTWKRSECAQKSKDAALKMAAGEACVQTIGDLLGQGQEIGTGLLPCFRRISQELARPLDQGPAFCCSFVDEIEA